VFAGLYANPVGAGVPDRPCCWVGLFECERPYKNVWLYRANEGVRPYKFLTHTGILGYLPLRIFLKTKPVSNKKDPRQKMLP